MFYSGGKDSLALLDLMAPYFKEIVCVFMYFVKDLVHTNKYLVWAENKYSNVRIIQVPHWNISYILRNGTYCVPNPNVKLIKLSDIDDSIRIQTGIDYSFYGMKKSDGLHRNLMLRSYGTTPISHTNKVYPLANWTNREVLSYNKRKQLATPIRYSSNSSGGVGFNLECLIYLIDKYPQDLEKILTAFPMAEKMLWEYNEKQNEQEHQIQAV